MGADIRKAWTGVVMQQQQQHVLRVSPEDLFYFICLFYNSQLSD
jgi:hypothetical protein